MALRAAYTGHGWEYKVEGQVITNGGPLGVRGIDVPVSGSLAGQAAGRLMNQHSLDQSGYRQDVIRHQVTTSDLAEQIKDLGSLSPAFVIGQPLMHKQRDRLTQKKKELMDDLARAQGNIRIGSRTFNELNKINKYLLGGKEDSQPPSPSLLTGIDGSEIDEKVNDGASDVGAGLRRGVQFEEDGSRQLDAHGSSQNRGSSKLKGDMHMIGEEEERELVEDEASATSKGNLNLAHSPSNARPQDLSALSSMRASE